MIVELVRAKKEYVNLSARFIKYEFEEMLRLSPKLRIGWESKKKGDVDFIIKQIRAKARPIYGVFQIPSQVKQRKALLQETKLDELAKIEQLLQSHLSTKERYSYYPEFLSLLPSQINSVLDIGCGLNPIAFFYFTKHRPSYICTEHSEVDAMQINDFFHHNSLPAMCFAHDAVKEPFDQQRFGEIFDVCFMLKVLDVFETQKMHITYSLFEQIHANLYIVTFPLKTVSGKEMNRSSAPWFERMMRNIGKTFECNIVGDELVYRVV